MKRFFLRTAALSLAFGVAACAATGSDPGASQPTGSETSVILQDPVGLWGSKEKGQPWLELAEDGKVSGSDGCNRLTGTWSASEDLEFAALASTKMFCEGVDDWLSRAATATLQDGNKMLVLDADGKELGTLAYGGKVS
ncbi:META domain-containing protein [Glutamicibacter sp.]|uniref:META domain-containing protein n=1 Tax=Glutamicibacter sp. TaxID=1931995 RepID=UPI003D6A1304